MRILITGSAGLVGTSLQEWGRRQSDIQINTFDLRDSAAEDVCNIDSLRGHVAECDGVIHLAAVSRVIWGEQDPERCWAILGRSRARAGTAGLASWQAKIPIAQGVRELVGRFARQQA